MKFTHLQGIGKHPAIEAKDLQIGMTMVWNFGYTSVVKAIEFSKTGKTLTVTSDKGTRKITATRLVAVQ